MSPGSYTRSVQLFFLYAFITPFSRLSNRNMKVVFAQVVALAVGASAFNGEIRTWGTTSRVRKKMCCLEFG